MAKVNTKANRALTSDEKRLLDMIHKSIEEYKQEEKLEKLNKSRHIKVKIIQKSPTYVG